MPVRDVENDAARLEQGEIAFFVSRDLSERMNRQMCGFLQFAERNETNVVRLADFFQRPANLHIARQAPAAIGRVPECGNGRAHRKAPDGSFTTTGVTRIFRIMPTPALPVPRTNDRGTDRHPDPTIRARP